MRVLQVWTQATGNLKVPWVGEGMGMAIGHGGRVSRCIEQVNFFLG